MGFNEANYRRLRAYLLTRVGTFNWMQADDANGDPGCVACACVRLATNQMMGRVQAGKRDIQSFLGCSAFEAMNLWVPVGRLIDHTEVWEFADPADVHAAVRRLDVFAANYGVTPEPQTAPTFTPNEPTYLAELREFAAAVVPS